MDKDEPFYSTRDLYLATTLVCLKFYLVGTDQVIEGQKNQSVGFFKFENTPELQEARHRYNQGLLLVEPKMFITNLKSLKSEVVNFNQNPSFLEKRQRQ